MRAVSRAENVVRAAHVRHPVAHRLVDRFLERLLAGFHADDLRAHQAHPKNIQGLALHVVRAHVHHAFEAELRASCRGRHAMLAGTGLGDDAFFAHAFREDGLRERVVDFVRTGVQQIFALQINFCPATVIGQTLGKIQLGRPAREFFQVMAQLLLKARIVARHFIGSGQLLERSHERLGHKHPTIRAKVPRGIGLTEAWSLSGSGCGSGHRPTRLGPAPRKRKRDFLFASYFSVTPA